MSNVGKNPPRMSRRDIETIDNALNDFRQAVDLPPRDPRRREAAVSLRRAGFTASQIVKLSQGNCPRQTVDRWVAGAAAPAGAPAERAVEIIADAVSKGYTFDHALAGLTVQATIAAEGAALEDMLAVMKQLKDEGISLSDLIEHYKMMKDTGLQFADIKRHLDYKKALEKAGFGLDSLRLIQAAAAKFDSNPDTVLTAIDTYSKIHDLTTELDKLRESIKSEEERRTTLNMVVTDLESKQATLQGTINENQNTIQQLKRTLELGYNLELLRNLEERTRTLGGLDKFLTAFAKYDTLMKLEDTLHETQASIDNLNADRTKLTADNIQYRTEIDTTRKLIIDHKLGLQAFQELLQLCVKYGAPEEVFRSIRTFDNLKTLENKSVAQEAKLAELKEKEKQLTEKLDTHLPEIEKMLLDIQAGFKMDVDTTRTQLRADLDQVLKAVSDAGQAYQVFVTRAADNAPYMELLQLTKNPKSVKNARVLDTVELILKSLQEWIPMNDSVFKYPNQAVYELLPKVKEVNELLEKTERIR